MLDRSEQEIIKNWKFKAESPVVSIMTVTYNHELYITEALDSFLSQETDFPFEIVIGEDCSTDNTRKIVEKYIHKYPTIIKLVSSEKNVGAKKNGKRTLEACTGVYVAICEGDDYWTDTKKLQIQIREMEKYPMVNISFHPAHALIDEKVGKILSHHANNTKIFTTSEVILGGGEFCPTASLVIKKDVLDNLPSWYYTEDAVGDYFMQIFGSLSGGALYINKSMANYRISLQGSWTNRILENHKKSISHFERMINSLDKLNHNTNGKYNQEICFVNARYNCYIAKKYLQLGMYKELNKIMKSTDLFFQNTNYKYKFFCILIKFSITKILVKFLLNKNIF